MKKFNLLFIAILCLLNLYGQSHNYDDQNMIYSSISSQGNVVTVGASTPQGNYPNATAFEIVGSETTGSYFHLKAGQKKLWLALSSYGNSMFLPDNEQFHFNLSGKTLTLNPNATVSVGTIEYPSSVGGVDTSDYKLFVGGGILAEEVRVSTGWADYVFSDTYKLLSLNEVETFINTYGHLPNMPGAQEVENDGIEVGDMIRLQQEKIEELTLYIIQLNKKLEAQQSQIEELKRSTGKE